MNTSTPRHHLRDTVHDRDISDFAATVTQVARPVPSVLRVTLHLPGAGRNPEWAKPNVAIRFYLSERYEEQTRVYTVRSFDREEETVEVDVVQHGASSPMMAWSTDVEVGDTLHITGPRPHMVLPECPGGRAVLFADDTALPALYSILDQWPSGVRGRCWVSTPDRAAFEELPHLPEVELSYLPAVGTPLLDAARLVPSPEDVVVWAAGEREEMKGIRRHFRREVGLDKQRVAVSGYWRRGVTNTEIDAVRKENYLALMARGGQMEDLDDLSLSI